MANYIDNNGEKYVEFEDGTIAPVTVGFSLESGTLMRLTDAQLNAIAPAAPPTEYPLPASQQVLLESIRDGAVGSQLRSHAFSAGQGLTTLIVPGVGKALRIVKFGLLPTATSSAITFKINTTQVIWNATTGMVDDFPRPLPLPVDTPLQIEVALDVSVLGNLLYFEV
jgi:hypothetical protein